MTLFPKPKRKPGRPKNIKKRGPVAAYDLPDHHPKRIEYEKTLASALDLRIKGWSARSIALSLGIPKTSVERMLDRAFAELKPYAESERVRELELARLDELTIGVMENASKGDVPSVASYLAIAQRRMAIVGIDPVPVSRVKNELSGPDGRPIEHRDITDEIRAQALQAFLAKTGAPGA